MGSSSFPTNSLPHLRIASGPRGHWLLGHLIELSRDPISTFSQISRSHGDVVRLQLLGLGKLGTRFNLHVLSHPDDIAHVLDRNAANYPNAGLLRQRYIALFGPCILAAENQDWQRRRRLEAPAFSRSRLNTMAARIIGETEVTAVRWEKRITDGHASFDIVPDMMDLALRVAGRMLLSTDFGSLVGHLHSGRVIALRDMNLMWLQDNLPAGKRIWTARRRRFSHAKARIERLMIDILRRRRERLDLGESENDLLDILLNARDAEGIGWSDQQIAGEMHALVRAGQDTTASSVIWAILMIARHPEVEVRLQAELEEVLKGRAPEATDLPRLPYLRAVYDESLRLFPPIPTVTRTAEQEDAIRGHYIPQGGFVMAVAWLTHRDPRWWDNPDKFKPERFFNSANKTNRPKYAYFPFGGGARFCLGSGLALLQGPLILAMLVQRYRLCVPDNFEIRPRVAFTLLPDGGLPVTLERR